MGSRYSYDLYELEKNKEKIRKKKKNKKKTTTKKETNFTSILYLFFNFYDVFVL